MNKITEQNLREHTLDHTRENSWWVTDVRGIPLCRVCDSCEEVALSRYKPEVLGRYGNYEDAVEEQIEED